jgi:murein DD-endopeptidase MepM/ murein hydrolase activator NlpD
LFVLQKNSTAQTATVRVVNPAVANFHYLYAAIRDGEIKEAEAQDSISRLLPQLKSYCVENQGKEHPDSTWIFPVQNYGINMIGGRKGSDYIPGKYRFYNTHGNASHPAHDIFINDKNQDILDDNTNDYVKILAMTGGVVVSTEHFWDTTMTKKGGNFIYIYEPFSKMLYYYAHNDVLWVTLGDIVVPGQHIANMGRTGLNAYKKRSPTHLHFSMLQFEDDGSAKPIKPYAYLEKTRQKE